MKKYNMQNAFLIIILASAIGSVCAVPEIWSASAFQSSPAQRPPARRPPVSRQTVRRRPATPPLKADQINDAGLKDRVGPNSQGAAVIRAEILLDRAKFSPGEIGTSYNDNLKKAIAAFQKERGLNTRDRKS